MAENSSFTELSDKQIRAIEAILSGETIARAAKKARAGQRTLYTWMKDPTFAAALREARSKALTEAISALAGLAGAAVNVLSETLKAEDTNADLRVKTAKTALDSLMRAHGVIDTEERLAAIEAQLKEDRERRQPDWKN